MKRISLLFNDRECQTLNFIDITAHKSLKQVQQKTQQLSTLSASVHHEMLGPLKSNVEIADALMRHLSNPDLKKQAQLISISSKLVLFHANDLLDLSFL